MRYWVYINDKVDGPYDENKLVSLNGFSKNTLICSEEVASNGGQEWVKASSIFEFDEVPVQASASASILPANNPTSTSNPIDTSSLLARLDSLTQEISHLHQKLDSMQTHLDEALEQNKQLAQQASLQASAENLSKEQEQEQVTPAEEAPSKEAQESFPEQAAPKEEELIIRSALDSIYGEKVIEPTQTDEAFQDLLPEKEAEKVEEIEKELTFIPVEETQEEGTVKQALITTPSAEDITRDELINELTASPKEDILDQIIQEHQEQAKQAPQQTETSALESDDAANNNPSWLGAAAATVGTAAIAGLALNGKEEKPAALEESKEPFADLPLQEMATPSITEEPIANIETAPAMAIATDKTDPTHLEEVLPADQMPADVPADKNAQPQDQQKLETLSTLDETPAEEPSTPVVEPNEDTIEELVPGATLEKKETQPEQEGFYIKEESEETTPSHSDGLLTDKDLEDAFGPQEEVTVSQTTLEVPENNNPNDLTEIELKEGSTYLISDFVPPAQLAAEVSPNGEVQSEPEQALNKQEETIIQDMLAVTNKNETMQEMSTEGLPEDAEATRVNLENTIQAKRGAALDIKTVPMVPEPADSQRLDMDELDDVNAQHDVKTHKTGGKLTKIVIGIILGLLAVIILYVLLGILHLLPNALNVFAKEQSPAVVATEEFFPEQTQPVAVEETTPVSSSTQTEEVLEKVQSFPLPNGLTLKQFIESKHAGISSDLITWEMTDAVEPDNYSITVKVPPENPQNFKTVYRFNYNTQSGLLDPTISDSKNLLDQAYGTQG